MPSKKQKLVILDAHAMIHRAYHALPPSMTNNKGMPTGALYGLSMMLISVKENIAPDYIVAAYDLPGKTFRHIAFDAYKKGRKKTDEALKIQLQESRKLCKLFGIPIYDSPGFEADDIIGTITEQLKNEKGLQIIIASGDMDTLQLVKNDFVVVHTLRKGIKDSITYNEKAVIERYGFKPKLLVDYKGLRGDPSDNIPGVPGIGDKTATKLITSIGTIEEIYETLEKNRSEIENLIGKRLTTVLEENKDGAIFSKLMATIRKDAPIKFRIPEKRWEESVNTPELTDYFYSLDFRTLVSRLHAGFPNKDTKLANEKLNDAISTVPKDIAKQISVMFWLLNSEQTNPSLKEIFSSLNETDSSKALAGLENELKKQNMWSLYENIEKPLIPIVEFMEDVGIKIDKNHFKKLSAQIQNELKQIEQNIYKVAGEEFNINSPKQLSEILFDKLKISTRGLKKTMGGARSTRESELIKIQDHHPLIKLILSHRKLQKLLSTYIEALPLHISEKDGKIHTTLLQNGTATGRFASANPNLQNLPSETGDHYSIRKGFVADDNKLFASFDYSQVELRVASILSGDKTMQEAFINGEDIHRAVASKIFSVPPEKVTKAQRQHAKVINFGILYGMGINSLAENLKMTKDEAKKFYHSYTENFPTLIKYLDDTVAYARKHGYVETLFGRRRYIANINSHIHRMRSHAERMAKNAPIQGTATADIIKLALVKTYDYLKTNNLLDKIYPILQIHDEILFEMDKNTPNKVLADIQNIMENILPESYIKFQTPVPLSVDIKSGPNLKDLRKITVKK